MRETEIKIATEKKNMRDEKKNVKRDKNRERNRDSRRKLCRETENGRSSDRPNGLTERMI